MRAKSRTRTILYRRKRAGKTNYKSRIRLLLSRKPRLVVRRSLKNLFLQVVEYSPEGDKVLLSVCSRDLKDKGWKASGNNLPACYLLGVMLALRCREKGIAQCILDIGMTSSIKGCRIYSAVKGAVDSGLNIPHSDAVFPDKKRVRGEHIAEFAKSIKSDEAKFNKQFSLYLKNGLDPESLPAHFDEIQKKLRGNK